MLPMRVHLCGPGGAGKTSLKHCLMRNKEKLDVLCNEVDENRRRTVGVEVEARLKLRGRWGILGSSTDVQIFDHGGQQEFQVIYPQLLQHPMSIFILVIPIREETSANGVLQPTTVDGAKEDLRHWMSTLNALAAPGQHRVLVVANVFSHKPPSNILTALQVALRQWTTLGIETGCRLQFVRDEIVTVNCGKLDDWQTRQER